MSALKLEHTEQRVRAEDAVEIIDCGRASELTRGSPFIAITFENGWPPFIYSYYI
jgi:hypothetical protein